MTTPSTPTSSRRQKGVSIDKAIVYGTIAFWMGKKADEFHSHKWTVYVRGVYGEDISYFIKKVVFTLHPSFTNHVRSIEKFPFEVTESGWGEFEIGIRIHFVDPNERPVDVYQMLKLYPPGNQPQSSKKPVTAEHYDEIVFNEPTESFYKILAAGPQSISPVNPLSEFYSQFNDQNELKASYEAYNLLYSDSVSIGTSSCNSQSCPGKFNCTLNPD
eukprot:GILK01009072.1.p1 GENE.GILK01009072.1~~GILK01009072.1.p1  ORF type:complete len:225 (+),score=18.44 GILK01009072.1:28-675(+)